ncbi:hypothetical protein SprV_0602169900 [Sparganum proliferum]
MPTMSTNITHTNRPRWISPDPVHQPPANSGFCLRVCTSSNIHDVADDAHSHHRCSESPCPASVATSIIPAEAFAAATTTTTASVIDRNALTVPSTTTPIIVIPTSSDLDSVSICPHCNRTLTWSVTCESITQRLANQCLEHIHAFAASASSVHTVRAHSIIA